MKKKTLVMLLLMTIIFLVVACKQGKEANMSLPPEKDSKVTYKTSNLIYQNDGATSYSLGGIDSIFTFSNDVLSIKDGEQIR
ncbi:hypothetical protein [Desulfitobacterium hafniense]|nr:hypothetical protein [Desulfitobacterium hafniense]